MTSDPGLQPERTSLAWARTGLSSTAAALVLARVAVLRDAAVLAALSGCLAVMALAAVVEGTQRNPARRRRFEEASSEGLSSVARAAVVLVVALAVTGTILVLTS